MSCCAVATCKNYHKKTKGSGIRYHRFPKDASISKIWMIKCKRKDKINVLAAKICSQHFSPDDYDVNMQNEMLQISYDKPLKKDAIPTFNLVESDLNQSVPESADAINTTELSGKNQNPVIVDAPPQPKIPKVKCRSDRYKSREIRKRALERIEKLSVKRTQDAETSADFVDPEKLQLLEKHAKLQKEIQVLSAKNSTLQSELRNYKRVILHTKTLEEKKIKQKSELLAVEKVKDVLKNVFTPGQIKSLLNGGKRVKWTAEDIKSALSLRETSTRAYKLLQFRGYPLPSRQALESWTKELKSKETCNVTCNEIEIDNAVNIYSPLCD